MASRKKRNNSPSAGGVGSARGTVYQSKAAAWWLTRVLTQNTTIGALFGLSGGAFPIRVVGQTEDPVDDMRVEFNDDSIVFLQCKRSVSLSNNLASEFGKAWRQFCQQVKNGQESKHLARCILCYEEPNPALAKLHEVFRRARQDSEWMKLTDCARTKQETLAARTLSQLHFKLLSKEPGLPPLDE